MSNTKSPVFPPCAQQPQDAFTGGLVVGSKSFSPTLSRVLVATDLASDTTNLLTYAAQFCLQFHAKLYVTHVLHPDFYPFQLPETWPQMADAELELCQKTDGLIREKLRSIPYEMIYEKGEVWPMIRKVIHDKQINLLVAGTHGRTGVSKVVLGSVAEEIVRVADCPVLTIGPNVPHSNCSPLRLNRILYATDFSAESLSAVPLIIGLCKLSGAQLILLHCHRKGEVADAMRQSLREVIPLGAELNSQPDCFVEPAHHRDAILGLAHEKSADLIVLGIRRASRPSKLLTRFSDSVTYHIVTQAECPVLTVRK